MKRRQWSVRDVLIIIQKWNAALLIGILVAAVVTVGAAGQLRRSVQTAALPTYGKCVVIDAGHGSPDGGAVGTETGVQEKDLNLAIARQVQLLLEQSGAKTVVTRVDDNSIHDADKTTVRAKKISDLKNREKIMNASDADVFVSIHMNQFEQRQYRGHQVFYARNEERSKRLAQLIQDRLLEVLEPPERRDVKPADDSIYLMKQAKVPAVLVECGFLSNPEEEKLLTNPAYQQKIAWGIYTGIIQYFNQ